MLPTTVVVFVVALFIVGPSIGLEGQASPEFGHSGQDCHAILGRDLGGALAVAWQYRTANDWW